MTINATDLFERYMYDNKYDDVIDYTFPSFEVTDIALGQTIEAPLTNTDKLYIAGNVSAHNGRGDGNVACTLRRVTSDKSWHEFDCSIGSTPSFGGKTYRKLSTHTFVNMSGKFIPCLVFCLDFTCFLQEHCNFPRTGQNQV